MSLEQILTQQLDDLNNMSNTLNQELDAIVKRDHESLISVVEAKMTLLQSFQQRDLHIAKLVEQADSGTTEYQPVINQINEVLTECKKQNDVNQVAANQSQIASQKLKNILFGKGHTGYDKTGKSFSLPNPIARGLKA